MLELLIGVLGPLGLVLGAQFWSKSELKKNGVPPSLEPAMAFFRNKLLKSHLCLSPPKLLNSDEVELNQLVGQDLDYEIRECNKNKLKYYYLFEKENKFLPILFKTSPVLILIALNALFHFMTDPKLVNVNIDLGTVRWLAIAFVNIVALLSVCFILYTHNFAIDLIENSNLTINKCKE